MPGDFPADEYEWMLADAMDSLVIPKVEAFLADAGLEEGYAGWLRFRRALERWIEAQERGHDSASASTE